MLGETGRGICEHFGVDPGRVDLIVGTFSKSLAACGGFICAKAPVIEWLRYTLPGFVYSVGMPPHLAEALRKALSIIVDEPERLDMLRNMSRRFVDAARRDGFDVGSAIGVGVIPIIFDDPTATMMASKALLDEGIYAPPVVQIGVPKDRPRLRFFLSAHHTETDVDRVFDVLRGWRLAYKEAAGSVEIEFDYGAAASPLMYDAEADVDAVPLR